MPLMVDKQVLIVVE